MVGPQRAFLTEFADRERTLFAEAELHTTIQPDYADPCRTGYENFVTLVREQALGLEALEEARRAQVLFAARIEGRPPPATDRSGSLATAYWEWALSVRDLREDCPEGKPFFITVVRADAAIRIGDCARAEALLAAAPVAASPAQEIKLARLRERLATLRVSGCASTPAQEVPNIQYRGWPPTRATDPRHDVAAQLVREEALANGPAPAVPGMGDYEFTGVWPTFRNRAALDVEEGYLVRALDAYRRDRDESRCLVNPACDLGSVPGVVHTAGVWFDLAHADLVKAMTHVGVEPRLSRANPIRAVIALERDDCVELEEAIAAATKVAAFRGVLTWAPVELQRLRDSGRCVVR